MKIAGHVEYCQSLLIHSFVQQVLSWGQWCARHFLHVGRQWGRKASPCPHGEYTTEREGKKPSEIYRKCTVCKQQGVLRGSLQGVWVWPGGKLAGSGQEGTGWEWPAGGWEWPAGRVGVASRRVGVARRELAGSGGHSLVGAQLPVFTAAFLAVVRKGYRAAPSLTRRESCEVRRKAEA